MQFFKNEKFVGPIVVNNLQQMAHNLIVALYFGNDSLWFRSEESCHFINNNLETVRVLARNNGFSMSVNHIGGFNFERNKS